MSHWFFRHCYFLFVLVRRLGAHTDRRKSRSGIVRYTIDHSCSATAVGAPRQFERGNCQHLRDQVFLKSGSAGECFVYKIIYLRHACMRTESTCISIIGFDLRKLSQILCLAKFPIFIRTRSVQQNRYWIVVWKTPLLSPQVIPTIDARRSWRESTNVTQLTNVVSCLGYCRLFPGCL
jgi:hypothetical protein